jgi:hypothetical protein
VLSAAQIAKLRFVHDTIVASLRIPAATGTTKVIP